MNRHLRAINPLGGGPSAPVSDPDWQEAVGTGIASPAVQLSTLFPWQSYFESTLLERAIQPQLRNSQIVHVPTDASGAAANADTGVGTLTRSPDTAGYALGLHPSSQTPVAVRFRSGKKSFTSSVLVLKPGQIVRPVGAHRFEGIDYGIPFGWLGGGLATLVVFKTKEADAYWTGNPEIPFHRARFQIYTLAQIAAGTQNNAQKNWPMRFPWTQALRGTNSVPQQGAAVISIAEPTKVVAKLQGITTLIPANTNKTRIVYQATNEFGLDDTGTTASTPTLTGRHPFEDITWPSWTDLGAGGNLSTQTPVLTLTGFIARAAADEGGIAIIDASGAAVFAGGFVDMVRYGRL